MFYPFFVVISYHSLLYHLHLSTGTNSGLPYGCFPIVYRRSLCWNVTILTSGLLFLPLSNCTHPALRDSITGYFQFYAISTVHVRTAFLFASFTMDPVSSQIFLNFLVSRARAAVLEYQTRDREGRLDRIYATRWYTRLLEEMVHIM
jgi:hypothetical protein